MSSGAFWLDVALLTLLGLMVGSFLNVVVHRLPLMMQAQWRSECAELNNQPAKEEPVFNLAHPRSRCPHCQHQLSVADNLPLLSYLLLGGRCRYCKVSISPRYPLLELLNALLYGWCAWRWGQQGMNTSVLAYAGLSSTLLTLAAIDWDTTFLPDSLTLPLLWAGLIGAQLGWTTIGLPAALWGAVGGYLSLWLVYWAFKLTTGKEGMGFGDFKLFAALGAWFGWQALIPIILMASVIGAVVGIALKLRQGLREGGYIPFGPFLVGAGLTALLSSPQAMLRVVGL